MDKADWLDKFWEIYLDAAIIPPFKALKNKRGDQVSSRLMWYLRFLIDPEHEYINTLPKKERETLLIDYCEVKPKDLETVLFKEAAAWYRTKWISKVKRVYIMIGEKLEQAELAIEMSEINTPEDIKINDEALTALSNFKKHYEEFGMLFTQERKAAVGAKYHGSNETPIGPADSGGLFS